jgi:hypothetical protein
MPTSGTLQETNPPGKPLGDTKKQTDKGSRIAAEFASIEARMKTPDVEDYEWDKPEYDEGALERYVRGITNQKIVIRAR